MTPSLTPQMVLDINVVPINTTTNLSSDPSQMVAIGSTAYFTAADGIHGEELWKSDGTADGTVLVKNINPGSTRSDIRELTNVNGTLFFTIYDGTRGMELWKSDGTADGTIRIKDIRPNFLSPAPGNLTDVNGTLFFTAYDDTTGIELWKSDGTADGTVLVSGLSAINLTNVNGTLFFSTSDATDGWELWKSDGTAAGTALVKDIIPGSGSSSPSNLTDGNGTLFFTANEGPYGTELWKSDGTAAGTVLVKHINTDTWADIFSLTNLGGTLFFTADDGTTGYELWKSDGTADSTTLVKEINPGLAWSSPGWLTNVNGTLFFSADDGIHGTELWTLVDDTSQGTTLAVSGFPATVTAGVAGTFTVTASNPDGTTNTGYLGTVHFTSSDPQAVLPADYTFTAADQGLHTFSATLKTAGSQSITAADTIVPSSAGTQAGITVNPAAASRFTVAGFPAPVTAGTAGGFTVTAWDAYGNRATGYTGTVRLTSSDARAALPGNYTFTAADAGLHAFSATLKTAGYQSLTATDVANGALTGAQGSILVNAAAASRLVIGAPASVKANTAFSLTVTVVDAYGNVVTGYRGTLSFRSSDSTAKLPKNYKFTAADRGAHTFTGLTLKRKGKRTITVTDTLNSSLTASALIEVL